jgi:hypothetical protein
VAGHSQKNFRTTTVSTKLTALEASALRTKATTAHVPVSTFIRAALLRSRLHGSYVPPVNQEAWVKLVNLEEAIRRVLVTPHHVDDVTLVAFLQELTELQQIILGRRP